MKINISKLRNIKLIVFDFDGVMTDNKVIVDENGKESVVCHRGDGLGLGMLSQQTKIEIVVMSKEINKVVAARCRKLKILCIHGLDNKVEMFKREIKKRNIRIEKVCFVGNDLNDLECMKLAGISIAVADAYPIIIKEADLITTKNGGNGAVREICDWILAGRKII